MDGFLSTIEAAERLGVSPRRLRNLIRTGQLRAQRIGSVRRGQWLVEEASVEQLRDERERNPPRPGRRPVAAPSAVAEAKRRSRARQQEAIEREIQSRAQE